MSAPTVSAAILAGGRARRFGGRDKSRLVIEGRSIIVRQVEVLQRVAGDTFIIGRDSGRFRDLGLPVHDDLVADAGAIGGLYTALEVAAGDLVLVIACDLPFLEARLLLRLLDRASDHDGAWISTSRGIEPLLACYRKNVRGTVRAQIDAGRLRLSGLAAVLRLATLGDADIADLGPLDRLLANVNTPDDYARVQYPAS